MRKRNTILALVTAGLLTVVAFTPALPVELQCTNHPSPDRCQIYAIFGNSTPPATAYQAPLRHIKHTQSYHTHYFNLHG
jgi:hypothetical protein